MTPKNFCDWLEGYLDLARPTEIGEDEIAMIREHLKLTRMGQHKSQILQSEEVRKSINEAQKNNPLETYYC